MTNSAYQEIRNIVGPKGVVEKKLNQEKYLTEWRGYWRGSCDLIVRPNSVHDVSSIVKICNNQSIPITPQAGNTGLVGGGVPSGGIVLSLDRMDKILNVNASNSTLTCESGTILKNVQAAADSADRIFPLSLASEESCLIGGNLATNAGGVHVVRYGNMRDLVVGLEVVLPNGKIWNGLRSLKKDNTGYDLKHLFIGSEGTLGIITRCILKLFPKPQQISTAFVAAKSIEKIIKLFLKFSKFAGETLSVFEYMNSFSVEIATNSIKGNRYPFSDFYPNFVLVELTSSNQNNELALTMESILSDAIADGTILNAVLAKSIEQRSNFWRIRETIPEAQNFKGASIKNDISVPISNVQKFIEEADKATSQIVPNIRHISFGHIGDGNIHYNLSQPKNMEKSAYLENRNVLVETINDIVQKLEGSFSAEHGIGLLKKNELTRYRSNEEVELMKMLKRMLDPRKIMNPGKLL